jgi:DNA-binding NarL/FixJ family response regulator
MIAAPETDVRLAEPRLDRPAPVRFREPYAGVVSTLRVVVADDSVLLREGLVRVLIEAGMDVVAAYPDAEQLLNALPQTRPDVILLDVRMPPTFRDEGVRAAILARKRHPNVGILLLSQYVEVAYAQELLSSGTGGVGYLLKDRVASLEELQDAVNRIAAGGTVLDPEVVAQLLGRRHDPLSTLTPREREVLALMGEGRTNIAIAQALVIGTGAVEKNVTSIFQKLGLDDSGTDHRRVLAVLRWLQR